MNELLDHIDDLIVCMLGNDLDDAGMEELRVWASASEDNMRYVQDKCELWFSATNVELLSRFDIEQAFAKFQQRVAEYQRSNMLAPSRENHKSKYVRLLCYAASLVAVVLATGFLCFHGGQERLLKNLADITIEAPVGSRTMMQLPDGSRVWLNSKSRMSYSQAFGVRERKVKIVGEAYFEVQKNESLPFCVESENIAVRVLGTKFNFCDYTNDAEATVVLEKGKVAINGLHDEENIYYLKPHQKASMDKKTGQINISDVVANSATSWTKGVLMFKDEPLDNIVKVLEHNYGVKVTIATDVARRFRFNGDFNLQEQTLWDVLNTLSETKKVRYRVEGKDVILY